MYSYIIYPSMVKMQHFVFELRYSFSQSEALYRYHGNQIKITHIILNVMT